MLRLAILQFSICETSEMVLGGESAVFCFCYIRFSELCPRLQSLCVHEGKL